MFQGQKKPLLMGRRLLLSLVVISCFSGGSVKVLNQIGMDYSDGTVLPSLGTSMTANWASSFRPHGAYVDEIDFVIFGKAETAQAMWALQWGEIDEYHDQYEYLLGYPVRNPDVSFEFSSSTLYKQLVLNSGRFPTNITAFRRAIAYGFDKNRANRECTGGNSILQDSYIPLIATEWEVESQLTEHFYGTDFIAGNISLENAGFKDLDSDGWREYDTNHNGLWDASVDLDDDDPSIVIDLSATAGNDPDIIACHIAQDGLEQMGIRSNILEKDYSTLLLDASNGSFWAFTFNTAIDLSNPPAFLYNYFKTNHDSSSNIFWFSNSTIDATLDEMVTATTLEEVKEKAAEATTLLTFEQPAIVCYNDVHINGYRTDKFTGFFEFKGNGYAGRNPYCATKVQLGDSPCPYGGTFKMSMLGDLETTNIHLVNDDTTDMVMGYIYEKLWQVDPLTWDPIPELAYDWDIEQTVADGDIRDGQKFTFYLYENETWHDGEPFTAADVNHSLHMWRDSPNHGPEMWDIYKVEIPDNYTIELYVNETGYIEWADTTSFYVTPEHIWREIANVTAYSPPIAEVIGTGPYKLNTWVPGEYIRLLRHEDWRWDIRDVSHILQSITMQSPVGGETYFGPVTIDWSPVEDIFNHDITYTISYSPDNGTSWETMTSNLTTTSFILDSTTVEDGSWYLIRVNASCSEDSWIVAMSDYAFTIDNVPSATSFPSTQISNSSSQSDPLLDLLPVLQILGLVAILFFMATVVIIVRRQRLGS